MASIPALPSLQANASMTDVIDHISLLQKTITFMMSSNLGTSNIAEIGGWILDDTKITDVNNTVGLSSDATSVPANDVRIWAGDSVSGNAPFRVYGDGSFVATKARITGGAISWGAVGAPLFSDILGTKPPADADNTTQNLPTSLGINYTKIGATYVYTGTLNANQINAGTINANYINGGTISGVDISVANDITVGNNIYFKPSDTNVAVKSLNFGGRGSLEFRSNLVRLSGITQVDLQCGLVTVNSDTIATQPWVNANVVAKFG